MFRDVEEDPRTRAYPSPPRSVPFEFTMQSLRSISEATMPGSESRRKARAVSGVAVIAVVDGTLVVLVVVLGISSVLTLLYAALSE